MPKWPDADEHGEKESNAFIERFNLQTYKDVLAAAFVDREWLELLYALQWERRSVLRRDVARPVAMVSSVYLHRDYHQCAWSVEIKVRSTCLMHEIATSSSPLYPGLSMILTNGSCAAKVARRSSPPSTE